MDPSRAQQSRARKAPAGAASSNTIITDPHASVDRKDNSLMGERYDGDDQGDWTKYRAHAVPLPPSVHSDRADIPILLGLTALAAAVRFYKIWHPAQVVFDEVHFGKFASYYLRREYYFDVHPPLAKMLNALAGWFAGFDGSFEFENIGDDYIKNNVPYVKMRAFPAILGAVTVPLVYQIMRESGYATTVAALSACLLLFDNGHIAQDRLILLDAALVLFMTLSLYSYIRFYKQRYNEFSTSWWFWMIMTGVNLALTMSCKMVGLFTFLTVGTAVLVDLWGLMDIRRGLSMNHIGRHFFARAFGLILVPAAVYMFWFWVHFAILTKSGTGDSFMSSEFQQTLHGNPMLSEAREVHYYDTITAMHKETKVYLHSHPERYPLKYDDGRISSQGQQVTGYPYNDTNNIWQIVPTKPLPEEGGSERAVRHKDVIRLLHVNSDSFLLTHDVASPLMATNEEFTTVPANDTSRYNDTLFEFLLDGAGEGSRKVWKSKSGWFRLVHVPTRVSMWTHTQPLPEWAFSQQEINGNKNAMDKTALWYVDDLVPDPNASDYANRSEPLPPRKVVPRNFFKKFAELQLTMLQQNAHLTASHPYATGPINWPFLLQGISFWTGNEQNQQIYMIGNLVSWWGSILSVSVFLGVMGADSLARRRGIYPIPSAIRNRLMTSAGFFVISWAFHYLPFFLMSRQLFIHHYLPAHVCSVLVAGAVFNFITTETINYPISVPGPGLLPDRLRPRMRNVVSRPTKATAGVIVGAMVIVFWYLAPLTYGDIGLSKEQVNARRLLSSWTLHFA